MKKYYYLYKITNQVNGKIYIGVHQTNNLDDDYMGSGTLLKRAKDKYGLENFTKEILQQFDSQEEMYSEEAVLVDREFILREDTYNISEGGNCVGFAACSRGGIVGGRKTGHINGKKNYKQKIGWFSDKGKENLKKYLISEENLFKLIEMRKNANSEETKTKRQETYKRVKHQQGNKNSQFGTMWITDGIVSKKINKEGAIPDGWKKGRKQKNRS